ncbi:conserved exported hypothetical protein [Candidatus Terasakiella magnetica]|nr:conserved exported hypothetical protein [Candidatus Terasakiella magnetica]
MRLLALASVLSLLAATPPAEAQMRPQPQPRQAVQPRAEHTERLVMTPPAGWQAAGNSSRQNALTTQLLPPGQTPENWTEMLAVQVVADSRASSRDYVQQIIEASRDNCEATGPSPVTEKQLNGYPAAAFTVSCTKGRQTGLGGLVMVIAIRGRESLYVIQRIWRGQPFGREETAPAPREMLQEWANFSRNVSLCDTVDTARHPCPKLP